MVTPCPLCHLSLDAWQKSLEEPTGRKLGLPIFHLSQLVAWPPAWSLGARVRAPRRLDAGRVLSRLERPATAPD